MYSKNTDYGSYEDQVKAYLENKSTTPLKFSRNVSTYLYQDLVLDNSRIEDYEYMVIYCIKMSSVCRSLYLDGSTQTDPSRNRSVLDIWRHIKFFNPSADIFSVMRALYSVTNGGWYCCNVHKRVFASRDIIENVPDHYHNISVRDEFDFITGDWETIGL